MPEPVALLEDRPLEQAEDYAFLRAQGLAHIQDLSGALWTDHNLHDPGVTILELLCYALTDLGYRTGFPVRDLLARPDGEVPPPAESGLFPAHEVLPNAPLTVDDYRRLLLKVEGVRNAWLAPVTAEDAAGPEPPVYVDCITEALSYEAVDAEGRPNRRLVLSGLYRVLIELEIDDVLGSLNETRLVFQVRHGPLKGVVLSVDSEDPRLAAGELDFEPGFRRVKKVVSIEPEHRAFRAKVQVERLNGTQLTLADLVVRVVSDRPRPDQDPVAVTAAALEDVLADAAGPMARFWAKQQTRAAALAAVRCVLHAHRNLCEDFLSVETVPADRIAVCADIEVRPDADMEAVQARVYHAVENYLNPPVRFYTLKELLDEGLSPDDVYAGPYVDPSFRCAGREVFPKPGFVKSDELKAAELRRVVHTSDLINLIMDLPEVVSIKNVLLRRVDARGRPVGASEKWTLRVAPGHQPVLEIERSKILFFKGEIPYLARPAEARRTLDHLRAMARKQAYGVGHEVLAPPRGRFRDPGRFFPIQHDLPRTYATGEAGLPDTAPPARVARARQLKAYLAFYDQLLADYLAQLANVGRLFSLDETLSRTHFSAFLAGEKARRAELGLPATEELPAGGWVAGVRRDFEEELYVRIEPDVDGGVRARLRDDAERGRLTEDEALFDRRRNLLLDHLAARFAERFTDYVLMMFSLEGDPLRTGRALVEHKIRFLREYPVLSRERGRAFDYRPEDPSEVWDTENVSGLEKRLSRLLGFESYLRRDLACAAHFGELFATRSVADGFRLEVKEAGGAVIFKSQETFATREAALDEARKLYPFLRREESIRVDASGGASQVFYTLLGGGVSLRHDALFERELDAVRHARRILDRYDELLESPLCDVEGLHLIEHILLRPRREQDPLMEICVEPECEACGDEDPYTFRISVVLPYWPRRFRSLAFRRFLERTLREETPAHVLARICWIGNRQMELLDRRYRDWLEAEARRPPDPDERASALGGLIETLHDLKTVYPAATLHDCLEDDDENIVRLGTTNLGIF